MSGAVIGVIPARYGSTRLKAKPLADICGKSLIRRVYEGARSSRLLDELLIATDDERIIQHAASFGARAVMTSQTCRSGTERAYEATCSKDARIVVNIQGDEPLVTGEMVDTLVGLFDEDPRAEVATLVFPIISSEQANNPNVVKAVCDNERFALYFSRSPIPYYRTVPPAGESAYLKHIGMYGYRKEVFARIAGLLPTRLEEAESLEQLRWLGAGVRIKVGISPGDSVGIDTEDDLARVRRLLMEEEGR
ncbi:MAG: 3-deoxy-manno-octulosonate cytidylyltransferase [Candidatus Omnitrophica bacterium]|nr:3-deoxy-manno-octulosonate cytidylyltransferase [Candidatus Omnitrophota bacterium]